MECRGVQFRLDSYLAGTIHPILREEIRAHLEACPGCREELASLMELNERLDSQPSPQLPQDFTGMVMARVLAQPLPTKERSHPSSWRQWGLSLIAAGLVLLFLNSLPLPSTPEPFSGKEDLQVRPMASAFQSWSLRGLQENVANGFYDLTDFITQPVSKIRNLY
jgi:anti-sigma factor RsiW